MQTTSTDLQTATNFTLSAWFKTDKTTGQQHMLWQGIGTEQGWGDPGGTAVTSSEMHLTVGHWSAPDNISFFLGWDEADPESIDIISNRSFTDTSEWHHAAVVVTDIGGGSVQADLYVDGVLEGSDTGSQIDRSNWDTDLRIGRPGSGTRFFDGAIDEVGVWTEALTPAQIAGLWRSGVMANDTDDDGSSLSASLVTGPTHGTLNFNADGSFQYTPHANFSGVDTFTYKVNDGQSDSNVATVTINVNPAEDLVVANDDSFTTDEDTLLDSNTQWSDSDWQYRRLISFDNSTRAEDLTEFPVLITLDSNAIDYAKTQDQGQGLRFYDADGNPLAHEIETWDETGTSRVWVKVPQIDANSSTDYIHMYYGNASVGDGQNAAAVWSDYSAVYHLNEDPGAGGTLADAGGTYDATNVGSTDAVGYIGNAQEFDGSSQYIDLGSDRDWINNATGATLSLWMNTDTTSGSGDMIGVTQNLAGTGGSRITLIRNGDEITMIGRTIDGGGDAITVTTNTSPLTAGQWHHITGTIDYASDIDNIKVYVDGQLEQTFSHDFALNAIPNTDSTNARMGSDENSGPYFDGRLDEARIAAKLRSADWISAQYAAMTGSLAAIGGEQILAGVVSNDIDLDKDTLTVTEVNGSGAAIGNQITLASGALLTMNADGTFDWDPNGQYENLDAGDQVFDTFNYTVDDGNGNTDTATVTITINGVDDASVVTGTVAGAVTEGNVGDAPVTATGSIAISDVDDDDSPTFNDVASTVGDNGYGSFVLTGGTWTYTLDQSAVQNLDAGDVVNDTITFTSAGGSAPLFFDSAPTTLSEDIDGVQVLDNGHLILSVKTPATLGGLSFGEGDLVEYDPVADTASLYFDGATLFADPNTNITAFDILDNGHIVLATEAPATLGGLSFDDIDLVDYDPATDTATLFLEGALTTLDKDISSVHVLDNGHIILSAKDDATLGGLSFKDSDLVDYDPSTDTATLYFDGASAFADPTTEIRAVHVLDNGHVVLATEAPATLGGLRRCLSDHRHGRGCGDRR